MGVRMDQNKHHYVVVTGIVIKDGRFLITKFSDKHEAFPNQWTVPGGKLVVGDYKDREKDTNVHWYNVLEDVLRREIMEEVGISIKNIRYLTSLTYIRSDNIPTLIISLFADHNEGDIVLGDPMDDHAWISFDEAKGYDLIEGIYEELEMLDKLLKGDGVGEWKKGVENENRG
jgi:8-oxo-dGTP pyrophosphatase MutT (NUDIX family)